MVLPAALFCDLGQALHLGALSADTIPPQLQNAGVRMWHATHSSECADTSRLPLHPAHQEVAL